MDRLTKEDVKTLRAASLYLSDGGCGDASDAILRALVFIARSKEVAEILDKHSWHFEYLAPNSVYDKTFTWLRDMRHLENKT